MGGWFGLVTAFKWGFTETEIASKVQDKRGSFIMREGFSGRNFDFVISRGCFVRSSKIGTNVGANVLFTRGRNHIQTVISLESSWRWKLRRFCKIVEIQTIWDFCSREYYVQMNMVVVFCKWKYIWVKGSWIVAWILSTRAKSELLWQKPNCKFSYLNVIEKFNSSRISKPHKRVSLTNLKVVFLGMKLEEQFPFNCECWLSSRLIAIGN